MVHLLPIVTLYKVKILFKFYKNYEFKQNFLSFVHGHKGTVAKLKIDGRQMSQA